MPNKRSRHGTVAEYVTGCRCPMCKSGWAFWMRDYRERKASEEQYRQQLDALETNETTEETTCQ
jgi:hypothetical protein